MLRIGWWAPTVERSTLQVPGVGGGRHNETSRFRGGHGASFPDTVCVPPRPIYIRIGYEGRTRQPLGCLRAANELGSIQPSGRLSADLRVPPRACRSQTTRSSAPFNLFIAHPRVKRLPIATLSHSRIRTQVASSPHSARLFLWACCRFTTALLPKAIRITFRKSIAVASMRRRCTTVESGAVFSGKFLVAAG